MSSMHEITLPNDPSFRAVIDIDKQWKMISAIARANGVRYHKGNATKTTEHLLPIVKPVTQ